MSTVKEVFAPHLGRNVKLGRRQPVAKGPRMKLSTYLRTKDVPPPPPSCDYFSKASASLLQVYLNDQLGDCVIAGGYHCTGVFTGNATGTPFVATSDQILADYEAIGGYKPGDPSTDQGCDEQTAINYWVEHGFANGTKLCGSFAVDGTNQVEVEQACYLFENLYFGVCLPDAWINPFPSAAGFTWDAAAPDFSNGHCFVGDGYDTTGVKVCTWGLQGTITWAGVAALCAPDAGGQLYCLLSPDQIARGVDKAPNGLDWATLIEDFDALGGNVPQIQLPPAPTPPVQPSPTTIGALEELLNWLKSL